MDLKSCHGHIDLIFYEVCGHEDCSQTIIYTADTRQAIHDYID